MLRSVYGLDRPIKLDQSRSKKLKTNWVGQLGYMNLKTKN